MKKQSKNLSEKMEAIEAKNRQQQEERAQLKKLQELDQENFKQMLAQKERLHS